MCTEEIVLKHGNRGMNLLKSELPEHYYRKAANKIINIKRGNVFILTGFYVDGKPETDGPTGAYFLAKAFQKLGFAPYIFTDGYVGDIFETIPTLHIKERDASVCRNLMDMYQPVFCLSIEYCGRNKENDYTNMHGISIREHVAGLDEMILLANNRGIPTIGIGDGGNEAGMGNLYCKISELLPIKPSIVKVDDLLIATVSNWAAYALLWELQNISHESVFPAYDAIEMYYRSLVEQGCVDGFSRESILCVDGFPVEIEKEIIGDLEKSR